MTQKIPEKFLDLLTEKRAFAHLATVMSDGTPQVTPVWIDYDGQHILVNSAKGRLKDVNMEARPTVAVEISDPENPYRFLSVRGTVTDITEDGADDHIDKLAKKYMGKDKYPNRKASEIRRIYTINVDKVFANG